MGALFNLLRACGIRQSNIDVDAVCGNVGGACGSGRHSDPRVCAAAQTQARNDNALSLVDPAGIVITELGGAWRLDGQDLDINNPQSNHGIWEVSRGGHRAILNVRDGLTLDDDPVASGAQVSNSLDVAANVVITNEVNLPEWAKTGKEHLRRP